MEEEILNTFSEEEKKEILHAYNMWEWNFSHLNDDNLEQHTASTHYI